MQISSCANYKTRWNALSANNPTVQILQIQQINMQSSPTKLPQCAQIQANTKTKCQALSILSLCAMSQFEGQVKHQISIPNNAHTYTTYKFLWILRLVKNCTDKHYHKFRWFNVAKLNIVQTIESHRCAHNTCIQLYFIQHNSRNNCAINQVSSQCTTWNYKQLCTNACANMHET